MRSFLKSKKTRIIAFAAVALLTILTVGATLAYYKDVTGPVINSFKLGSLNTEIEEEIDDLTKKISVKNEGGSACLVRIRVTATPSEYLEMAEGNPVILDFEGTQNPCWEEGEDEFWYYQGVLNGGANTNVGSGKSFSVTYKMTDAFEALSEEEQNAVMSEMNVTIYQEAVQATVGELSAIGEDGNYNHAAALKIWKMYEAQQQQ